MILDALERLLALPPWLLLVAGVVMLIYGADWLVDGAVAIARHWGISVLLVGLTVVAFGTSAPELAVNVFAAINGNPGLSFGNVVGSNIANVGLVLGLGALAAPLGVHSRVLRLELPALIAVSVAASALALLPMTELDGPVRPGSGFSPVDGLILLAMFVAFGWFWQRLARADSRDPLIVEAQERAREMTGRSLNRAWLEFGVGLVGLVAGGKLTEQGAVGMAEMLGWSNALIGLTVVAVSTSLPEVVTVLAAAKKGHSDLAVGNVVGSNIFNLLLVMAVTAIIAGIGPERGGARGIPLPPGGVIDLAMMVGMTLALWFVALRDRPRDVNRREGLLLLLIWLGYMAWRVSSEL